MTRPVCGVREAGGGTRGRSIGWALALGLLAATGAIAQDGGDDDAALRATRARAEASEREGRWGDALADWTAVIRKATADPPAWLGKARCHEALRQFADAVFACDRALKLRPGWPEAAELRARARTTGEAIRVARQLGENFYQEGQYESALDQWAIVIAHLPDEPVAWFFRGGCHAQLRRHAEATSAFDRALALRPGWPAALSARAGCALLAGDWAGAQRDFRAAIAATQGRGEAPDPRDVQLLEQAVECQAGAARAVVGEPAPPVRCRDAAGRSLALADLLPATAPGKAVLLLFHGGLRSRHDVGELARLREHVERLAATGATLYCVSGDSPIENRILAEEKGLPFPLLSDSERATATAYGMVDLRQPGEAPGTLLGLAILDVERRLRHRQVWLDPEATLDWKALAVLAGKITGTPPPADDPAPEPPGDATPKKEPTPR